MPLEAPDILQVFVESPGDLLFFFLVISFSLCALFLAVGHRSRFPFELATRRYGIATGGLVVIWLVMLGAAALARFADLAPDAFMPPMERLAFALSMLVLAWAFLSADFDRWQQRANLLLFGATLLLALLYLNSARGWLLAYEQGQAFNSTEFAQLWSGLLATLAAIALVLALFNVRAVVDAPLKALFFLVLILGNGWDLHHLSQGAVAGNYLGAARLSYLASLVLLPLIIYRLSVALLEHSLVEVVLSASQPSAPVSPRQARLEPGGGAPAGDLAAPSSWELDASRAPADRRHLPHAMSLMLETRESERIPEQIVKAAIDALQVEVCALLRLQDMQYADIIAGFDQVTETPLAGLSLNLNEQPTLREAATRRDQTILFPEYHKAELEDLFRRLNIPALGNVYAQPLAIESELIAVLMVSMPYRGAELAPDELESLRDIGFAAAYLLAWSFEAAEAQSRSAVESIEAIAERSADATDAALAPEALRQHRLELESSLERVKERSGRLARQIADLKRQEAEQQIRLLNALDERENREAARRLSASFDEQSQLRARTESSARKLLEAETVLRVLNAGNGETLAQIIREFMHKEYNLLLAARDRMRRQINALLVMGEAAGAEGQAPIMQALADESAQLELEREQQQRRLDAISGKLASMDVDAGAPHLTQILVQLYAERMTLSGRLAEARLDRRKLLDERDRLLESDRGDGEALERQLKGLSADHEQLLNSREDLRRRQQALEARVEAADDEKAALQSQYDALRDELSNRDDRQTEIARQLEELAQERDNLLTIRDQLTARVHEATAEATADELEATTAEKLALQASLRRLTEQREQLALELSDARLELSAARQAKLEERPDAQEETEAARPNLPEVFGEMLGELGKPLTAVSDYADLLLAESIGILGAAQLQALEMIAAEVDKAAAIIGEIQQAAQLDATGSAPGRGSVDVLAIIEDVIDEASAGIARKGLSIELALGDQLPPVEADESSLKNILAQLVTNASAVSPSGTQITVSAATGSLRLPAGGAAQEAVEISVRDRGGGIALEDMQRVFARKYRAENREIPGFGDSGVGMTVARAFARAHAGDLWITSEAGVGSSFHLALPMQAAAPTED